MGLIQPLFAPCMNVDYVVYSAIRLKSRALPIARANLSRRRLGALALVGKEILRSQAKLKLK